MYDPVSGEIKNNISLFDYGQKSPSRDPYTKETQVNHSISGSLFCFHADSDNSLQLMNLDDGVIETHYNDWKLMKSDDIGCTMHKGNVIHNPATNQTFNLTISNADEGEFWVTEGIVLHVTPMNYSYDAEDVERTISIWELPIYKPVAEEIVEEVTEEEVLEESANDTKEDHLTKEDVNPPLEPEPEPEPEPKPEPEPEPVLTEESEQFLSRKLKQRAIIRSKDSLWHWF